MQKVKILIVTTFIFLLIFNLTGCTYKSTGTDYTIPQIDLSVRASYAMDSKYDYIYDLITIDDGDKGEYYLAHPDSVLINKGTDNERIITMYPAGHGKGAIITKISSDNGLSYNGRIENTPSSWENSKETPTIYELDFTNGDKKLVLISANPNWKDIAGNDGDGFNVSLSSNNGESWSEFQKFYGKGNKEIYVAPIVAMSSLTRLKENGEFVDKWMGLFHTDKFKNYKTILTFNEEGVMNWSTPVEYFKGATENYFAIAKKTNMCEVEVIRSENGLGNKLCLLTRSNTKKYNSLISFSTDEGETWSQPKEVPAALNGERHKASYTADGRLIISFRSIERSPEKVRANSEKKSRNWYSEGNIAWVGTFEDLEKGDEGQYRIKLAHTYLAGQTSPSITANADTGYCGNVVLKDDTVVISSYGCFDYTKTYDNGKYKTYIASKRFRLVDIDELVALQKNN